MNVNNRNKVECSKHGVLLVTTDMARAIKKAEELGQGIALNKPDCCNTTNGCVFTVNGEVFTPTPRLN